MAMIPLPTRKINIEAEAIGGPPVETPPAVQVTGSVGLHRATEAVARVLCPAFRFNECSAESQRIFRETARAAVQAFLESIPTETNLIARAYLGESENTRG